MWTYRSLSASPHRFPVNLNATPTDADHTISSNDVKRAHTPLREVSVSGFLEAIEGNCWRWEYVDFVLVKPNLGQYLLQED